MKVTKVTITYDKKAERSQSWKAIVVITDEGKDTWAEAYHGDPHHAVHAAISDIVKRLSEAMRMGVQYRFEGTL